MIVSEFMGLLKQIIEEKGDLPIYIYDASGMLSPATHITPEMNGKILVIQSNTEALSKKDTPHNGSGSRPVVVSSYNNDKPVVTEEYINDVIAVLEMHATRPQIDLIIEYYAGKIKTLSTGEDSYNIDLYIRFVHFLWINENNFKKFYTEDEIKHTPILDKVWK